MAESCERNSTFTDIYRVSVSLVAALISLGDRVVILNAQLFPVCLYFAPSSLFSQL